MYLFIRSGLIATIRYFVSFSMRIICISSSFICPHVYLNSKLERCQKSHGPCIPCHLQTSPVWILHFRNLCKQNALFESLMYVWVPLIFRPASNKFVWMFKYAWKLICYHGVLFALDMSCIVYCMILVTRYVLYSFWWQWQYLVSRHSERITL